MGSNKLALLTAALLASSAIAAEDKPLQEVTVEGKNLSVNEINSIKTPTPILDVPQSLSIFTAEQITQQGVRSIGDIIDYTPGVNTSQGEGHRDSVVFRGVRSTADFYIDGARDDVQYYRPLYNLEQVEILRGPNALLFGRGGTGGILNRVTKKAQVGDEFIGYKSTVNTFGEVGVELDGNYTVNDKVALRLNMMYEGLDNHRDFFDGDRIGLNPTARILLTPDTILDLSYEYIDHKRFIDRGIPTGTNGEPVEALKDIVFADPTLNFTDLQAHVFRAGLQHNFLDNLKGNFSVFYGDYDKVYSNFYASAYDQANTPNVVTTDGYVDTTERQNLILSGNLIGEFETGSIEHTVMFGAEYIDTSSDQNRFNAFWSNNNDDNQIFTITRPLSLNGGVGVNSAGVAVTNDFTADLNDDTRVDIDVHSFYIQDEIQLTSWLDVVLGARYDSFDIEVNNVVANQIRTRTDDEISPRVGVIFKPRENISIYGSYSESFLPRSGEQFANINGTNNQLDPDVFENAEVGLKWDFESGLSLTAAYFQNEQTRAARDNITGENFEVRGLEVDGIEIQLQGQITDKLYISAGYSHMDGETGVNPVEPRELPENMFSIWSGYQFTSKFGVGLGLTYQDESLISDGGTATLPDYTRVDAAAYYDWSKDLRFQVNIENLTNEVYFPNAHATHQATVGAPINALFTVTGKF